MDRKTEFNQALLTLLENVRKEHGDNALVTIRVDDKGVVVIGAVSRKILYDADTLPEFTHKYFILDSY